VQNRQTKERFRVEIESDNERFILPLAPGEYELIRVQINEGPFLSIAQLASTFSIGRDLVTYLGTWRFGVDSPKYGRMVSVSMVSDEEDRAHAIETLTHEEPSLGAGTVPTVLPDPTEMQARLYEVMPYPRVPRYFRRHWVKSFFMGLKSTMAVVCLAVAMLSCAKGGSPGASSVTAKRTQTYGDARSNHRGRTHTRRGQCCHYQLGFKK
jgi:hypothetical protein